MGDLPIGNPEDMHLLVSDSLAGRCDAIEGSDVLAGHGGRGHHHAVVGCGFLYRLLQFETQIGERVAQPLAGRQESRGAATLTFGVVGIVVGFLVHEVGCDDALGQLRVSSLDEPEGLERNTFRALRK